jgi:hypothetical protein
MERMAQGFDKDKLTVALQTPRFYITANYMFSRSLFRQHDSGDVIGFAKDAVDLILMGAGKIRIQGGGPDFTLTRPYCESQPRHECNGKGNLFHVNSP